MVQEQFVKEQKEVHDEGPSFMNAFELISLFQGLDLSALFDRRQVCFKQYIWFSECLFMCNLWLR